MSGVDFGDPAVLAELAAALEAAGVDGIEIDGPAVKIRIVVQQGAPQVSVRQATAQDKSSAGRQNIILSPLAGMFTSHHPSEQPSAGLPRDIATGDTLGFVRIGPVLLPVKTVTAGTVTRSYATDGLLVGYGDPLFEIEPRP